MGKKDTMVVFKALKDGVSPIQRYPWPLPTDGQPGAWVDTVGKPALCANGVHGYLDRKKAESAGNQVFEMEIEGDIVKDHEKAAGQRGRLIRQLSGNRSITLDGLLTTVGLAPGATVLGEAATALGVTLDAIAAAIRKHDVRVVDDHDALVPLEDYMRVTSDTAAVRRRVAPLAQLPLTVTI